MLEAKVVGKKTEIEARGTASEIATDIVSFLLNFQAVFGEKISGADTSKEFMDFVIDCYFRERETWKYER